MTKKTKIQAAIDDTKLRLKNVEKQIQLMIREKEVLETQLQTLEDINDSKEYTQ